jgi:hypothetical protein
MTPRVRGLLAVAVAVTLGAAGGPGAAADDERMEPLRRGTPAWFTADLARQVLDAGYARVPGGVHPIGVLAPGIHPSQWLQTLTVDSSGIRSETCTANFIFRKGSRFGLGTAGHCARVGAVATAYVRPPSVDGRPAGLYAIGHVVLSHDGGPGSDFAMIAIYPELALWIDPSMPLWGGPTGAYAGATPQLVKYVGHGVATGPGGTARVGYADTWRDDEYAFAGPAGPGDSGGGVLTQDGRAAGNQTHVIPPESSGRKGVVLGTRIARMLELAQGWRLVTG